MPEAATARRRDVDAAALEQEGARLWAELPAGAVVWLSGELGSGKTTLVQAITRAAGAGAARSPTYALIHEYASPGGVLVHVDCYRLRHPDEARDLDLAALARRSRLALIEWPERAGPYAPSPDCRVRLSHAAQPDRRTLEYLG
ncbi:MAG: tRNA (adenosine(37)-N6)-threonylcarbamoyltransferase complex ATPase subunit type 1 TsaE [Gemmatimonadetes bacterium]|nr:tRNA (adenosine(37)-N6)-threonylcarbamoyltransferase complex ATPase subunit type 1 TsaE [Gemmatimonadota bacterium]